MPFKDLHKKTIVSGFTSIHEQLADLEAHLVEGANPTAFSRYFNDLSPTEVKVVRDYFARLRSVMESRLKEADIPINIRRIGLRWVLQCGVNFVHIAVAEMSPDKLAGYGGLDDDARAEVIKLQEDLERVVDRIGQYLKGRGANFAERIARLTPTAIRKETLSLLDQIITRYELVEFRPQLDMIVERLTTSQFEIAVFGRVSSGKSSLLNDLAGAPILPVGVTPVTAVPTRLALGDHPQAIVSFAESSPREVPLDELYEYAAEDGNPGNSKHVTNILVRVPSPRLRQGVVFVDTPGVGSLATAGGTETLAYLPRCDLGVVLVDAGSSLAEDDLRLLRLLLEAGTSNQVLISKADLLNANDRQRAVTYTRDHLTREFQVDIPVRLVSTVGADEALLATWFEEDIMPLFSRQEEFRQRSLVQKLVLLIDSTVGVLRTLQEHAGNVAGRMEEVDIIRAKEVLDHADDVVRDAKKRARDWISDQRVTLSAVLDRMTEALQQTTTNSPYAAITSTLREELKAHSAAAYELVANLQTQLHHSLESLRNILPSVPIDVATVSEVRLSGLPLADDSGIEAIADGQATWWAMLPKLAVPLVRRSLEKRLGEPVRQRVEAYDRQLRSWMEKSSEQILQRYETQSDVIREQLRRAQSGQSDNRKTIDGDAVRRDIDALETELVNYHPNP